MRFILYFKQLFCKHKFNHDTQLKVIKCELCKEKHTISEYKSIF